ncbi:hypothetical protein SBBP2_790010 [Burkholderiales bacterium]|nr:hypothetical protein SBBP2_790010 [Burkholderiales bacterium]
MPSPFSVWSRSAARSPFRRRWSSRHEAGGYRLYLRGQLPGGRRLALAQRIVKLAPLRFGLVLAGPCCALTTLYRGRCRKGVSRGTGAYTAAPSTFRCPQDLRTRRFGLHQ